MQWGKGRQDLMIGPAGPYWYKCSCITGIQTIKDLMGYILRTRK